MESSITGQCAPRKVLLVEDNELTMMLFTDVLEVHGYETLQTRDGLEALNIARLYKPDLIVMDIQLPGMSGLEITRQLKADEKLRTIPVIAVTAHAMPGDREKIRQAGCEDYIAKPFSIVELIQTVDRYSRSIFPIGPAVLQ